MHHDVVVMLISTRRQSMESHGSTSSASEQAPPIEPNTVRLIYLVTDTCHTDASSDPEPGRFLEFYVGIFRKASG